MDDRRPSDDEPEGRAPGRPASVAAPLPGGRPAAEVVDDGPVERGPAPGFDSVATTGTRRARRRRSSTRNAVEWVAVLVGALLIALVVKTFLFQAFYIPSESMEPTLEVNDRVLVNKFSIDLGDIERGDIIVFSRPENASPAEVPDLIKRVVGLPGETVEARDGAVLVDGEPLVEGYLDLLDSCPGTPDFDVREVGPDQLFVLGDSRCNSQASNVFGPIDFDLVVGRAFVRVWPISSISTL